MKNVLYIVVLSVFTVVSAFGQQKVTLVGEPDKSGFEPTVKGPEIKFEKMIHEFGEVVKNVNGDIDFKFKNIGSEPLVLFDVRPSCGTCVTIKGWTKEPIMPGKEGVVNVRYNTHILGDMGKTVTVLSNAKSDRIVLRITGNVVEKK